MLKKTLLSLSSEDRALLNLDQENPRSLYNLLPSALKQKVDSVEESLFFLEEDELTQRAFFRDQPDVKSNRIRISFWREYDSCIGLKRPTIDVNQAVKGLGGPLAFYKQWCASEARVAWLLKTPLDYELQISDLHQAGLRQLEALMQLKPVNPDGSLNKAVAELQFKIYQSLDARIKGAVVQRIDQRTLNVNTNVNPTDKQSAEVQKAASLTMDEINERLASLEEKSQRLSSPSHRPRLEVGIIEKVGPAEADLVEEERRQQSRRERGVN